MLRIFLLSLFLASPLTSSLHAMDKDDAGGLLQRGKPIQLLKGAGETLEAVLGAGNNVLLKMSMDLNLQKIPLEKEQLEVPVRLFLTDITSAALTSHPAVDLNVKVDLESAPLTCVLPDKPLHFDSYGQFTDWLNQGYFMNKIMIAYDFHIDVQKSAPSLTEHLFSLPPHGYLFRGTHAIEHNSLKPDQCVPQVIYDSQRGTSNRTIATLQGTFYIKNQSHHIDEHQQIFSHPMIEQKVFKRDQAKKFYHHDWIAQSQITTMETYEEFSSHQLKDWPHAPSKTYSLLRQKPGDLKEISHIACLDGITGESVDSLNGKIFSVDVEGINEKESTHLESIAVDEKGKLFIMRYLYSETPREASPLGSLEKEAERLSIAQAEEREAEKVEKTRTGETVKQDVESLKKQLETTQNKIDEVDTFLINNKREVAKINKDVENIKERISTSTNLKAIFRNSTSNWTPYTFASWVPLTFDHFEGDERLRGNLSMIEIPEEGVYSLFAHYCWHANNIGDTAPYTAIAVNTPENIHNYFVHHHLARGYEASGVINRVTRLKKGDKVMVSIYGHPNAEYFLPHFQFDVEKIN